MDDWQYMDSIALGERNATFTMDLIAYDIRFMLPYFHRCLIVKVKWKHFCRYLRIGFETKHSCSANMLNVSGNMSVG